MEWENVREKVRGYDDHYYVTDVNRILMLLHEARSWNIQDGRFEPQEVRAEEAPLPDMTAENVDAQNETNVQRELGVSAAESISMVEPNGNTTARYQVDLGTDWEEDEGVSFSFPASQ